MTVKATQNEKSGAKPVTTKADEDKKKKETKQSSLFSDSDDDGESVTLCQPLTHISPLSTLLQIFSLRSTNSARTFLPLQNNNNNLFRAS